jgi:hypothetical protein
VSEREREKETERERESERERETRREPQVLRSTRSTDHTPHRHPLLQHRGHQRPDTKDDFQKSVSYSIYYIKVSI